MRSVMNFPFSKTPFTEFASRRSVVHSLNGMVACSQPLAATVGQGVLAAGGNAAVSHIYIYMRFIYIEFANVWALVPIRTLR